MQDPIMIDLVGDKENQLPEHLTNIGVFAKSFHQKMAHIQEFVTQNPDKKILIFTETKDDAKQFEKSNFANFLSIHGDLE